jgi:hypothetical protein
MGRLKVKESFGKVDVDAAQGSRVEFDSDSDNDTPVSAKKQKISATKSASAKKSAKEAKSVLIKNYSDNNADDDSDAPEEVSKFDTELMKMKELHEQSQILTAKVRKSRARKDKEAEEAAKAAELANKPLDPSVLAAVASGEGAEEGSDQDYGDAEEEEEEGEEIVFRIDKYKQPTKVFDNIEVSVLADNARQDNFHVSSAVRAFMDQQNSRHKRVEYSKFSKSKKPRPAGNFTGETNSGRDKKRKSKKGTRAKRARD